MVLSWWDCLFIRGVVVPLAQGGIPLSFDYNAMITGIIPYNFIFGRAPVLTRTQTQYRHSCISTGRKKNGALSGPVSYIRFLVVKSSCS